MPDRARVATSRARIIEALRAAAGADAAITPDTLAPARLEPRAGKRSWISAAASMVRRGEWQQFCVGKVFPIQFR